MYWPARAPAAISTSSNHNSRRPQGERRFCQSSCSGSSVRSCSASARTPGSLRSRRLRSGSIEGRLSSISLSSAADRRSWFSGASRGSCNRKWGGCDSSSRSTGSRDSEGSVREVLLVSTVGSGVSRLSSGSSTGARSAADALNRLSDHGSSSSCPALSRRALSESSRWRPSSVAGWISRCSSRASSSSRSRLSRSSSVALHCFWLMARGADGSSGSAGCTGGNGTATGGSLPACSSNCLAALNTCRQEPQRTTPRATLNWAWLTRKLVWQCGH
ncbi:hypothetical protein D3C84_622730 [compost metagenome]